MLHEGLTSADVDAVRDSLATNRDRVVDELGVAAMPRVRVQIWRTDDAFYQAMREALGQVYAGSAGYVYGPTELRLLLNPESPREAVHEFAHVVSLNLDPASANNPRWLWEAVALYEARQFVDPRRIPFLVDDDFPTLAELNAAYGPGGTAIYEVGYILLEYIVLQWSLDHVRRLILRHGDVTAVLGVPVAAFESGWRAFVRETYLGPTIYQ